MNIFRILPIAILLIFVIACGLNPTGNSDANTSSTGSTNTIQHSEDRQYDDRRQDDHERAIEEIRQDIHHIFERMNELNDRMDEMNHGMFPVIQDMGPMPNVMPPMGNVGNPQMNRPNNMNRGLRGNNSNNPEMTMKQRYERGVGAYKGKNYKEVISLFSGIINNTDFDEATFGHTSKKAYLYRGLAYYEQQQYIESLEDLNTYIESKPVEDICLSEAHKGRSLVYLSTGKETEATDDFTKATTLSSGLTKNPCLLY